MRLASTSQKTVLIVDDSRTVRQQIRIAMSVAGLTCREAVDGIEAWSILQTRSQIDLAIIDIQMPKLDGIGLAERIRASDRYEQLPFLMCSSMFPSDIDDLRRIGAQGWIIKPFRPKSLILASCKLLGITAPDERLLLDKVTTHDAVAP